MNTFVRALRTRRAALHECEQARRELQGSMTEMGAAYAAHPLPVLAAAAGVGLVSARFHGSRRLLRTVMRIGSGSTWRLLRQVVDSMR